MPFFDIFLKADYENITTLRLHKDTSLFLSCECQGCREISDSFMALNRNEQTSISGSRGTANLVFKCKSCKKECSVDLVSSFDVTDDNKPQQFAKLECRGCKPSELSLRDGFEAISEAGNTFDDIDLTEGEWYGYDEDAKVPLGITNVEIKINKC
ncbi:hypothetical protein ROZALSC1DRAFT_28526 [Rozella allomycis CSF55]|uniref:DUF866-domain-containing protein n=1 Tax=Rozella allomycis (strain CSF55) TaxID=988480 RepID=A0A4P9YK09_ROZAC|nr:hypothetical protein ROZALSC1DRAFT_28526 [Rozella allomycis CSF55]